jgi:hypothetical protein
MTHSRPLSQETDQVDQTDQGTVSAWKERGTMVNSVVSFMLVLCPLLTEPMTTFLFGGAPLVSLVSLVNFWRGYPLLHAGRDWR